MTDDLRRLDDQLLASLDKRLALLEQAHIMGDKAAATRAQSVERAVDGVGGKLDSVIVMWQNATAEASGSPAGRSLLSDIADLEQADARNRAAIAGNRAIIDAHDDLIQQAVGASRLIRLAFGTSLIALVASVVTIIGALT